MSGPHLMFDISHWQVELTPARAREAEKHADAGMFKSSEGTGFTDPHYLGNARAWAPRPFGAYHYVTDSDGSAQASYFLNVVAKGPKPDFLCVDWEKGGRSVAKDLFDTLKSRFSGPVIIYNGAWAREHPPTIESHDGYMVPQYGPSHLDPAYVRHPLVAWQYTDGKYNGTGMPKAIPGIGSCDISEVFIPRIVGIKDAEHHHHPDPKPKPDPKPSRLARYVVSAGNYTKSHATYAGAALDLKGKLKKDGDSGSIKKVAPKKS